MTLLMILKVKIKQQLITSHNNIFLRLINKYLEISYTNLKRNQLNQVCIMLNKQKYTVFFGNLIIVSHK